MNKYAEYVKSKLTERELLEQLAEEASELSQAALKLIRAKGYSNNVTPVKQQNAEVNLFEEFQDVLAVLHLFDNYELTVAEAQHIGGYWKWKRWAKRLGYKEEQDVD